MAPLLAWLLTIAMLAGLFGVKLHGVQRGSGGGILAILACAFALLGAIGGGVLAAKGRSVGWASTSLVSIAAPVLLFHAAVAFAMGNMH